MPKALFFDLDGTLLDSLPGIAFSVQQAFLACALSPRTAPTPESLRPHIGPPIRTILAHWDPALTPPDLDRLEAAFRLSYDSEGWQRTLHFPGSSAALRALHARQIPLFVVSNKPRHISLQILDREGILPLFTHVLTRDSTAPPFPDKSDMLSHLLRQYQIEPGTAFMVGDTAEDAYAAAANLIPFILMTHGYGSFPDSRNELPRPPVALRLDHFSDFVPALAKEHAQ